MARVGMLGLVLAVVLVNAGCSDGPQCTFDTDCDIGFLCSAGSCVPRQVADGGDVDTGVMDGGIDDTGPDDASMDADDAGGDTAPPDTGVDSGQPVLGTGTISITSSNINSVASYAASVTFQRGQPPSSCTHMTFGPCGVTECPAPPPPPDGGVVDAGLPPAPPNAGTVLINAETDLTFSYDNGYVRQTGSALLYNAPTPIQAANNFSVDVPPFMIETPTPSQGVSVAEPSMASPPVAINRNEDLAVRWQGTSAGQIYFHFHTVAADEASVFVGCSFAADDPEAASGTIPSAALARLFPIEGTMNVLVGTYTDETLQDDDGVWKVRLWALASAVRLDTGATPQGTFVPATFSP